MSVKLEDDALALEAWLLEEAADADFVSLTLTADALRCIRPWTDESAYGECVEDEVASDMLAPVSASEW